MTQVLALAARQMDAVGTPLHRHVGLGRQFRPAASFDAAAGPRYSPSPLATIGSTSTAAPAAGAPSRKRASAPSAVDTDLGMVDSPGASAAGGLKQDGSRDLICLCTPAPKIPRPRNAFILYRQHHQAQVTAANPKLSNPDISKIIGEKWKNESDEVKHSWKRLAKEEKQRHQSQYPNYRYQPRRGNKPQTGWASASPSDEQARCPKCSGRAMATPQTPSTPFATSPAAKTGAAAAPQGPPSLQKLDTALSRRSSLDLSPTSTMPLPKLPPMRDVDAGEAVSPDMKRRRADGAGGYHAINGPLGNYGGKPLGDVFLAPVEGASPNPANPYGRAPLPEPGTVARSQSGPMPPPLRPSASTSWLDRDFPSRRNNSFDESLRLPPLQTSNISPTPSRTLRLDGRPGSLPALGLAMSPSREHRLPPVRTLRDKVMSISLKHKIAVLASICQPVPALRRDNNQDGTRGPFIAVEGPDPKLLQEAGSALERGLMACGEIMLKVWRHETDGQGTAGGEPGSASQLGGAGDARFSDCFEPYFKTISSWQKKSVQIGRHITGANALVSGDEQQADGERAAVQGQGQSPETGAAARPPEDKATPSTRIPVALAKEGYSLTIADRFACATTIRDMYSPVDHWQWMATLWRGTVCPDLIVYVDSGDDDENKDRRTVELSRRMGLIVVKVPAGKGLDEGTERRLAFEVMEWMREGSFRHDVPRNWRSDL